ncbi:MAG: ABC transporter substrate-binding protein, partial [Gaiella sp.]
DYMDPALAYFPLSWQLLYATCAKLVNYPGEAGPEGSQLVPEVAESLPERSADGRTFSFRIRRGFRFSPPSNQPVTAQTFKYAIERSLSPEMKGGGQYYLGDVVGAEAFMAGKASGISGVVARGDRLTIRLVAPAPDLPTRLALPFFCAVPIGTPRDPKGVRTIPSAGPYYVSSYGPGQGVVLTRNPNYEGGRPQRPDRIQVSFGISARKIDSGVEAGRVDYNINGVDPAGEARVAARYGRGSAAARTGRQRYFVTPRLLLSYIILNTSRPLFADARLRRAVNYAIDRAALAGIGIVGIGPERPTDQYLPPGMPGFKDARVYPLKPDVTRARALAGPTQRVAVLYTCQESPCDRLAQTIKTNLAAIGIQVTVEAFPADEHFTRLGRPGEPFDLAVGGYVGWAADFPDPANFLNFLVGTGSGGATPAFTDPGYQRKVQAASRLAGPPRYLTYGKLDAHVSRAYAPWVPLGNPVSRDFFSARMGCQVVNPVYGVDLAGLCIKG